MCLQAAFRLKEKEDNRSIGRHAGFCWEGTKTEKMRKHFKGRIKMSQNIEGEMGL